MFNRTHVAKIKSARQRRQSTQAARVGRRISQAVMDTLEKRCLLSSVTAVTTPTTWMSALPGGTSLTDVSLPGTTQSASGPTLQDALLGSGSSSEVNPANPTTNGVNDAALAAHAAAAAATEAAILAGGNNQVANGAAIAADTAALAADIAAGITQTSTGAGLAIGLASDVTGVAAAIASAAQTAVSNTDSTVDAAADSANTTAGAADTTAGTTNATAGTTDATAGGADATAGTTDTAAGTADAAAGTADATAGTTDTAAAVADGLAAAGDVAAGVEGGIDPVADGVAAGLDTAGAVADTAAGTANTAADVTNGAADAANATASTASATAATSSATAATASATASASQGAAATANTAAGTAGATAATAHTAAAVSDGISAASYFAGAASDALTAEQYGAFANGMSTPDTTGSNPNNAAYQSAIYGLAVTGATAHSASAAAETAAAIADTAATVANTTAATTNAAAVTAVAAATAANAAATAANVTATAAAAAATTADAAATAADAAATAADSAATAADSAAEALEAAAGITDGVSAAADAVAATADTTAIALDITALATIEIPFVDIATAAAAGIADGVAVGLDVTSVAADTADGVADGLAVTADGVAVAADAAAVTADAAASAADVTAATADVTATTADTAATTADTAAVTADAAATTACQTATSANTAADAADATANTANHVATIAGAAASAADIAFTAEVTQIQTTQTSVQTQSLGIADQLDAGIRSLDLRGTLVNDNINLNAGQYFTGVTLQDALNDMTSFLQANPSETLVVSLSANENPGGAINSPNGFNTDLNTLLNSSDTSVPGTTYKDFVYYSSNSSTTTTPNLDQVRGKIVFVPSSDKSWTPVADLSTGLTIGWQPTQVTQDKHNIADPNARWNYAENDNGANDTGLIPTDLGNPSTLYRNNLNQDNTTAASPVALGDSVNAIAEQYFTTEKVTRTTGIVGMDDPAGIMSGDATETLSDGTQVDETLINAIVNENNLPIIVTSDSDASGDTGTLRDAIIQANSQPGINTIEFADSLTGSTGNTIVLQSDLPQITNDLNIAGSPGSDFINTNGHLGLEAASTHSVTETDFVASDSGPVTPTPSTDSTPVYLNISGLTDVTHVAPPPLAVDPVHITYGTALANSQLSGTATESSGIVPGSFAYTSAAGAVLNAGNGQFEAVTFTPTDTTDTTVFPSVNATVDVAKATPAITNVTAVNLTYGTALDNTQLGGTATFTVGGTLTTLPGTFTYTSAAGHILHPGNGQSESVTFIPTDTTDYRSVSSTVTVNVAQATPTVTVNPLNITFGTALDNTQLSGTATFIVGASSVNVAGTFTFTNPSAPGTVLNGGNGQSQAVTFTPVDTTDYAAVPSHVTINVTSQATPIVAINPVSITYGTALANSQLSGVAIFTLRGNTVIVPGAFTYTSAAGSVPNAGNAQSTTVTFTPTDTTDYASVSSSVFVTVAQATPTVASVNPVNLTYGTTLANGQLSGAATFVVGGSTVSVPGVFTYSSAAGSVLSAGNGHSEAVTFTPADTTDYTPASGTVTVNVAKATPIVGNVNPITIIYGTALSNNPVAEVDMFTPGGTITTGDVNAITISFVGGATHTVTFTTGSTRTAAAVSAGLVAAWNADPIAAAYATAVGSNTVMLTSAVPGSVMSLVSSVTGVGTLTKAVTTAATSQLSGTVTFTVDGNLVAVPGTFTYTSAVGSVLNIGKAQSQYVTFTPNDATDYTTASSTVIVNVLPIPPTVTVTDAGGIYKGSPFAATGTATGVNGVNLATPNNPKFYYFVASNYDPKHPDATPPLAGTPSDVGDYVAVADFTNTGNYGDGGAITRFSITPAATATSITTSVNPAVYGQQLTYTATVANISGTPVAPAGAVQFVVDGVNFGSPVPLSASGLNAGGQAISQTVSSPIGFLTGASHSVQAVYVPSINSNALTNFTATSSSKLNQVIQTIAVEGTGLFIGSNGALSADQIQINPIGSSNTGSTGVQIQTRLNGVSTTTSYSQVFSSVHIYAQNGNDNIQLNSNLILSAIVSAGNGNDSILLGNGNNVVTFGAGNDSVQAGTGMNTISGGNGNDLVHLGNGSGNSVTLGTGNDTVQIGNGSGNSVTLGSGNDTVQIGNGSNEFVLVGNGNDNIQLGDGSSDRVTIGTGADTVQIGNGNNNTVFLPILGNPRAHVKFGAGTGNAIKNGSA
jgi:hypothetical protein